MAFLRTDPPLRTSPRIPAVGSFDVGGRSPRSGPTTLLVGTALTIRQLIPSLVTFDPAPRLAGCLLPRPAILPIPVLGNFGQFEAVVSRADIDQVLIALPAVMDTQLRQFAAVLDRLGKTWRYLPPLADQLAGHASPRTRATGRLDPTQLIERTPKPLDDHAIAARLTGQTVLITGAGGSIGSALAQQVARFAPARLILLERSENALFEIDRQIGRRHPDLPRQAVMHDVTQRQRTADLLERLRPDVIFHAAAHKHVPVMEDHPAEAVENNFYGTRSIADAADACGCSCFVMISTDKAVNPTSVMGATKRLAELYIRHLDAHSQTTYCMVRFGNVLGSACSLIPIWTDQLLQGGPLTVTHPDMTRYFMTIPEAAGLVLQAGAYAGMSQPLTIRGRSVRKPHATPAGDTSAATSGGGGEVFLLDMGKPIRILDLADRFLRLQGFEPNVDVKIQITGTRPGEKLFEELAYDGEDMTPTPHPSIRLWRTAALEPGQMPRVVAMFDRLREKGSDGENRWANTTSESILTALRAALPEMLTAAAG